MAGSQLKQLKEALKNKGLVGQTNIKRKNKKAAPSETRKDQEQRKREIGLIRDNFNQFDKRINRAKHDYTVISGGKFVKAGSKQHNDSSKTHSSVEQAMRLDYEASKKGRNRVGGVIDKRFGEKNKYMTEEEKMLQRFTRERQSGSKNVFSLGSDDEYDDDEGFALTHSGKKIAFSDEEADDGANQLGDFSEKRYVDEDSADQPQRKKSKKDVMAEIIAKSKFYKKQRQQAFEKTQEEIMDLDDEFKDVIGEIENTRSKSMVPKSQQDIDYDNKVRELTYDRRAVPAERTKTDEELAQEHKEKMRKLEEDRLKRMSGVVQNEDEEGDDLGDAFWAGSDEENAEAENAEDGEDDEEDSSSEGASEFPMKKKRVVERPVTMPNTHAEFMQQVESLGAKQVLAHIEKLKQVYHPRLAEGNKQKLDHFVGILLEHILELSNRATADSAMINELTKGLRSMAEKYNEALVQVIRDTMAAVETRIIAGKVEKKDLVFFVVLGYLFSTSDHYHLVVTPALILLNQYLCVCLGNAGALTPQVLGQGLMVCEILLSYQSFAKRFDPEVVKFVEICTQSLLPEPATVGPTLSGRVKTSGLNLAKSYKPKPHNDEPIAIQALFEELEDVNQFKFQLLGRCLSIMDRCVATWREKSASIEVIQSFSTLLKACAKFYSGQLPKLQSMLERYEKLVKNMSKSREPLTLQEHKKLSIKTLAPQFEENFNPDKKSYDVNKERQELNKMAAQIKKERKSVIKDIRKQTKFVARQQIEEKKDMYEQYHRKMANIVNSISTVEGAEKNQYEREKKKRQNQK